MKLTDYLAMYAAFISTFVLVWNIRNSRPDFKVKLMHGIGESKDGTRGMGLFAYVENSSSKPVFIKPIGFLTLSEKPSLWSRFKHTIKYKRYVRAQGWVHGHLDGYGIEQETETKLEPGQSFSVFISMETFNQIAQKSGTRTIRAFAQNALGENRYSSSIEVRECLSD